MTDTGSRDGAIGRAERCFNGGQYIDNPRKLVAVRTESQRADSMPELRRYCADTIPTLLEGMGFACTVVDNPKPGCGPVMLASRIEDPSRPTVLIYGHGDVVHGHSGR